MKYLSKIVLLTAVVLMAIPAVAQMGNKKEMPVQPSAKEMAERMTRAMKDQLALTDKQYKKVYKINLAEFSAMESRTSQSGSMQRPPMGGGGPMGGGPMDEGAIGSPMGGRPEKGQSRNMQGGKQMEGGDMMMTGGKNSSQLEDREALMAKKEAKLKKVLTPEQFGKWKKIEKERMTKEFWDKDMPSVPNK